MTPLPRASAVLWGVLTVDLLAAVVGASGCGPGARHAMDRVDSEYDFLARMVPHHEEAVAAAEQLLDGTDREQVRTFAREVIETESSEIDLMLGWLAEWYPEPDTHGAHEPVMRDLPGRSQTQRRSPVVGPPSVVNDPEAAPERRECGDGSQQHACRACDRPDPAEGDGEQEQAEPARSEERREFAAASTAQELWSVSTSPVSRSAREGSGVRGPTRVPAGLAAAASSAPTPRAPSALVQP